MKIELIFLGAPASGKGTQTNQPSKDLNLPHVDTGGMLREAIAEGTEAGKIAKTYMDKGELVPIEIVKTIIQERLQKPDCANGFILDGYPRSIEQAEALESILNEINKGSEVKVLAINLDVSQDELISRIVNRRLCPECGAIYNLKTKPPLEDGLCDKDQSKLIQRPDDTEETAKKRLDTYNSQTKPLIEYYANKGILKNIDGSKSIDEIYSDIKNVLKES